MEIKHDLKENIIDTIKGIGIIVNNVDINNKETTYYHLPQWFKEVNGELFECKFEDLPYRAKATHIRELKHQWDFISKEMEIYHSAMSKLTKVYVKEITPYEFFNVAMSSDDTK